MNVNVVLKAVEARRYQDPQGQVKMRIDHNSHISLVQAHGDDRITVDFQFTTSYGAFGVVKTEGAVHIQKEGIASAAQAWETDRKLPPETAQMVHSAVLQACVPEAVGLAKTVRLPPPIPLPQVNVEGNQVQAKARPDGPDAA
ncbi:MAG: hypothetical protein ACPHID_02500 [Thermoplasmatota archaeon]